MVYQKSVLSNGVTVLSETHPNSRAVSCGIWIETGTRDERRDLVGISHFLEHMVFKGTKRRSAYELSRSMESVGGDLNAYTSREYTCFHATSLKEDLKLNLDVLCDLVVNARFSPRDFEKEKTVVVQEIAMTADSPEEYIFDLFLEHLYPKSPLGWPILGTEESLKGMKRRDILAYYKRNYSSKNMIVSVAGAAQHDVICETLEKSLRGIKKQNLNRKRRTPTPASFSKVVHRESEQAHIVVGIPATSFKSELRFEAFIVNALLGGGMTSRLYQTVRERRGLAYTIYSQLMTFVDTGMITIYAGTDAKHVKKTLALIMQELVRLRTRSVKKSEVDLFVRQVRGNLLLGADDIENRMTSLGVNEMVFGQYRSVEQVIADVEKVTAKSVNEYIADWVDESKSAIMVMGNIPKADREWIENLKK